MCRMGTRWLCLVKNPFTFSEFAFFAEKCPFQLISDFHDRLLLRHISAFGTKFYICFAFH